MDGGEPLGSSLTLSSKQQSFDVTFTEVSHNHTLNLINDEQLRLFHLAVKDNRFSHTDLVKLLRRNIGRYVFSRAELAEYDTRGDSDLVALDAVARIESQGDKQGLGELLLYILLEQVLDAPKVLSKIELNHQPGAIRSKCDAIHLLLPDGTRPVSSIVFGTSSIIGDVQDAIDAAFTKITQIETGADDECQLAEAQVFTANLEPGAAKTIADLLIPTPGGSTSYDTAYGVFLAYDLGLDPLNYTNIQYREALDKKMEMDLAHHATYIADKISTLKLSTHSFYIYLLPFDDILKDADAIMNTVLNRGGGARV